MNVDRFGFKVGEALVADGLAYTAAETEVVMGELNEPFGATFAKTLGRQSIDHTRAFARLGIDVMVRPVTLCVSKIRSRDPSYRALFSDVIAFAAGIGVLDAIRLRDIPISKINDIGLIMHIRVDPEIVNLRNLDTRILFDNHREAAARAIQKAIRNEHSCTCLLNYRERVIPKSFSRAVLGDL